MIWDSHIHTSFSGDCDSSVQELIRHAATKQLPGITITDHLDLVYPEDPSLFLLDLPAYDSAIRELCANTKTLSVRYGIELGLAKGIRRELTEIVRTYDYDFVIGSSHLVHGMDPYYPAYFEGRSVKTAVHEYFVSIYENILDWDGFDVYGHLDYVVRYCPAGSEPYRPADHMELIDEILKELIARGKGIEINTAGFAYGLSEPHPAAEIIKRYRALGGEIITIGSDAHVPENTGYDFMRIPDLLRDAGFSYYTVYKKRQPEFIRLP